MKKNQKKIAMVVPKKLIPTKLRTTQEGNKVRY